MGLSMKPFSELGLSAGANLQPSPTPPSLTGIYISNARKGYRGLHSQRAEERWGHNLSDLEASV